MIALAEAIHAMWGDLGLEESIPGGLHTAYAPEDAAVPYAVVSERGTREELRTGDRECNRTTLQIRVYGWSAEEAGRAADAMHEAIRAAPLDLGDDHAPRLKPEGETRHGRERQRGDGNRLVWYAERAYTARTIREI